MRGCGSAGASAGFSLRRVRLPMRPISSAAVANQPIEDADRAASVKTPLRELQHTVRILERT